MPHMTKIATCSFCGTRSVLKLREIANHTELSCARCAAPLHEMKPLKLAPKSEPVKARPVYVPAMKAYKPKKKRPQRSRFFADLIEEIWDELEDILD